MIKKTKRSKQRVVIGGDPVPEPYVRPSRKEAREYFKELKRVAKKAKSSPKVSVETPHESPRVQGWRRVRS